MDGSFPSGLNRHPTQGDLTHPQMVIPQYGRYSPGISVSLHRAPSVSSVRSRSAAASASPPLPPREDLRASRSSPGRLSVFSHLSAMHSRPSMSPPLCNPLRSKQARDAVEPAVSRSLPSRALTDETIDDAFVSFIFYCNPNVPLSIDTSELRKTFRSPPRSDGKSFSIFTLWELIQKLDKKEIKTWIQLAIELGVEPPSLEKKQSTQKLQQYTVRLKRWMRAMHIDAFFEYCLGHAHPYYTQLPPPGSLVTDNRDGVPPEEDLALRALVPQWRPKRGRKRAEDKDLEESLEDQTSEKRPRIDTSAAMLQPVSFPGSSTAFPASAIPFSPYPDDVEASDPWIAVTTTFVPNAVADTSAAEQARGFRWRSLERDGSPVPYAQSAAAPRGYHPANDFFSNEPRSATVPSSADKSRMKRRHGPAVSSAWSGGQSSTGKVRGRPPNRTPAAGTPFSLFSVSSDRPQQPLEDASTLSRETSTPGNIDDSKECHFQKPIQKPSSRLEKLHLQVPQRVGAPVRLATPPALQVNGLDNTLSQASGDPGNSTVPLSNLANIATSVDIISHPNSSNRATNSVTPDDVINIFSAELIRGRTVGRSLSLRSDEAMALAASVINGLTASYSRVPVISPVVMSAIHLGYGESFGFPGAVPSSTTVKVRPDGIYTIYHEYKLDSGIPIKTIYSGLRIGPPSVDRSSNADSIDNADDIDALSEAEFEAGFTENPASEGIWKQRYLRLRGQMQKRERALSQYKRKILESVMEDI